MTSHRRFSPLRLCSRTFACAVLAVCAVVPAAAAPVPLGPEVSLDPSPGIYFRCPALAGHDDGSFAAAWARTHSTADTEVVVRTADAGGALAPAREVVQRDRWIIELVRLAATPDGYTVLWRDFDGARQAFLAEDLEPDGETLDEIDLGRPQIDISPRPVGGFVSAWIGGRGSLNVQLLDAQGGEARAPVKIAAPRAAWLGTVHRNDGAFAVFWRDLGGNLAARRFDAFGSPQGKTVRLVSPPRAGRALGLHSIALGDDGTLAVAYTLVPAPPRIGQEQLLLRTFDATGRPLQGPVLVATGASREVTFVPSGIAVDVEGNTLVLWMTFGNATATTQALVLSRGSTVAETFSFTSEASGAFHHVNCATAAVAGDSWVIAWLADDRGAGDGEPDSRVFARRFARE